MSMALSQQVQARRLRLERNVRLVCLLQILGGAPALSMPTIALVWQQSGLSLAQSTWLQALFIWMSACFQVPTGYFADIYSRRASLLLSTLLLVAGFAGYSAADSFGGFLAAELTLGLAMAFMSGADQALLKATLQELGRGQESDRLWGLARQYSFIGMALWATLGGFLGEYDLRWPLVATWVQMVPAIAIAWLMEEPRAERRQAEGGHLREMLGIVRDCLFKQRRLGWLIAYTVVIQTMVQAGQWLYQPYMQAAGVEIRYFGLILAACNLTAAAAARYAHHLNRAFGQGGCYALTAALVVGGYLLLGNVVMAGSFCFIFLHQLVRGMQVLLNNYIKAEAGNDIQATALSVEGMGFCLLSGLMQSWVGAAADLVGIPLTYHLLGGAAFLLAGVMLMLRRKDR
jgi:MFS family permease